jgi:hypothetical protein
MSINPNQVVIPTTVPYKCRTFQNYNNYMQTQQIPLPNICYLNRICQKQACVRQIYQYNSQRNYSNMTRNPQDYPIISWTQQNGLTPAQQRLYSNMWWRRMGSQMTTGTNLIGFGATAITGSDVPYTN